MALFGWKRKAAEPLWTDRVVKLIRSDKDEGWLRVEIVGYIRNLRVRDYGEPYETLEFFGRVGWARNTWDKRPPGACLQFRQSGHTEGRGSVQGGPRIAYDSDTRPRVNILVRGDEAAERTLREMCDVAAAAGVTHVPFMVKWTIPEAWKKYNLGQDFQMAIESYSFNQNLLLSNKKFSQDVDLAEAFFTPQRQ